MSGRSATPSAERRPPNIIVVVADDLGYADVGFHGGKEIPTPHLDRLAREGVVFRNGYVSGPYCSPTRAGFLTGRYQQRFGHEFNPPGPGAVTNGAPAGLSVSEVTLAERLKSAGYRTGLIGKWHLGFRDEYHPLRRGFDEFFGFLGAAHSYTNPASATPNAIRRGRDPVDEKEHLALAFTREAKSFIERHRAEPFFLYLAYNAVHSPLDPVPGYLERYAATQDPKRRAFATLLGALDDGVGAVRETLREASLEENTLVIFFSDNGGPPEDNTSRNEPLRGRKFQVWEGGVHIPFVAHWKGRLPAGLVYDPPVIQLDIFPTVLAAAGVSIRQDWKLDGVDLLPFLTGTRTGVPHDALYWRFGEQFAIREGNWKLVRGEGSDRAQLFDLKSDPAESVDLAAREPVRLKELDARWRQWNAQLAVPSWRPRPRPAADSTNGVNAVPPRTP